MRKPFAKVSSCGSSPSSGQCSERTIGPVCARHEPSNHKANTTAIVSSSPTATKWERGIAKIDIVINEEPQRSQDHKEGPPKGGHYRKIPARPPWTSTLRGSVRL